MEGRALGKGLSALIPDKDRLSKTETVAYVKTTEIRGSLFQPRTSFDKEKLADLIASIKEKGVLQPILVRKKDDGYEVVAGERRLRAAQALSLEEIPVVVKSVSDQEALVIALVENIQREELNAIEEARAYRRLINDFNFSQESAAQSVGKNRSTVTNMLRLLKLPEEIQKSLSDNIISVGHARPLLSIENPRKQKKLFEKTVRKSLSVREVENLVKQALSSTTKPKKAAGNRDPYVVAMEEELQRALGTKVRIDAKQKKGKILIEYYSPVDLERIAGVIKNERR